MEPGIIAHCLHLFLLNPKVPEKYADESAHESGVESSAYQAWEQQDALL